MDLVTEIEEACRLLWTVTRHLAVEGSRRAWGILRMPVRDIVVMAFRGLGGKVARLDPAREAIPELAKGQIWLCADQEISAKVFSGPDRDGDWSVTYFWTCQPAPTEQSLSCNWVRPSKKFGQPHEVRFNHDPKRKNLVKLLWSPE